MKLSEKIAMAIDGFVLCGGDIDIESLVILIEPYTAKLEAELEEIKKRVWCAYCGYEVPKDAEDVIERIETHISECDKHPLRQLKAENEALREVMREVSLGDWFVQCEPEIMKKWDALLIGEN